MGPRIFRFDMFVCNREKWIEYWLLCIFFWSIAPASNRAAETNSLRKAGASKENLWSLEPVRRPSTPQTKSKWARNAIDCFIYAKLGEAGLTPSPEADRVTLIRRLSFDLLGLPPAP